MIAQIEAYVHTAILRRKQEEGWRSLRDPLSNPDWGEFEDRNLINILNFRPKLKRMYVSSVVAWILPVLERLRSNFFLCGEQSWEPVLGSAPNSRILETTEGSLDQISHTYTPKKSRLTLYPQS